MAHQLGKLLVGQGFVLQVHTGPTEVKSIIEQDIKEGTISTYLAHDNFRYILRWN